MSGPTILQQLIDMDPLDVISLILAWEENTPAEQFSNFTAEDERVMGCAIGDFTQIEENHTDTEPEGEIIGCQDCGCNYDETELIDRGQGYECPCCHSKDLCPR